MSDSRCVAPARRSLLASSMSLSTPTISRAPARWADSAPPSVAVTASFGLAAAGEAIERLLSCRADAIAAPQADEA